MRYVSHGFQEMPARANCTWFTIDSPLTCALATGSLWHKGVKTILWRSFSNSICFVAGNSSNLTVKPSWSHQVYRSEETPLSPIAKWPWSLQRSPQQDDYKAPRRPLEKQAIKHPQDPAAEVKIIVVSKHTEILRRWTTANWNCLKKKIFIPCFPGC